MTDQSLQEVVMAEQVKGVDGEEYVQVDGRWHKAVPAEAVIPAEEPPVEP